MRNDDFTSRLGKTLNQAVIWVISPGGLEPLTQRGGGIETFHARLSNFLSKHLRVILLGPYYRLYQKETEINPEFMIRSLRFPAVKRYPPVGFAKYASIASLFVYSLVVSSLIIAGRARIKCILVSDMVTGFLPALVAKILRIGVIYSEGNIFPWLARSSTTRSPPIISRIGYVIRLRIGLALAHLADVIRVQYSPIKRTMVLHGVSPPKIEVLDTIIDTNAFRPLGDGEPVNSGRIGFIGRLTEEKGGFLLARVLERANTVNPNLGFDIMGDGNLRPLISRYPNVMRVGAVPHDRLPESIHHVSIVITFQPASVLGIAELEAMACEKVVVAPSSRWGPDMIIDMETGILVDGSAESYVRKIEELLANPSTMASIGKRARLAAVERVSIDQTGHQWLNLVRRSIRLASVIPENSLQKSPSNDKTLRSQSGNVVTSSSWNSVIRDVSDLCRTMEL